MTEKSPRTSDGRKVRVPAILVFVLVVTAPAVADGWAVRGHLKAQTSYTDYRADDVAAVLGADPARDQQLDLRLKLERRAGPWDASVHYELLALHGDSVVTLGPISGIAGTGLVAESALPRDTTRLFDLTGELVDEARRSAVHRLDRLVFGYRGERYRLRVGRQAVTWGNGLVFNPLDFLNPFSPVAIDKDYKTGDDMVFAQWLHPAGADTQGVLVGRRELRSGSVRSDVATAAVRYRRIHGDMETTVVAAQHYGAAILGVGLGRDWRGAVWRIDLAVEETAAGDPEILLVSNLDRSWVWAKRNIYGFVEYFRNGLGEADANYANLSADLRQRLVRGELYNVGRDYVAAGLQVEWSPRVNLFPTLLWNLNDDSAFVQLRGAFDWQQNLTLMAGANLTFGGRGSEFGGIPSPVSGDFVAVGDSVFLRAAYFF